MAGSRILLLMQVQNYAGLEATRLHPFMPPSFLLVCLYKTVVLCSTVHTVLSTHLVQKACWAAKVPT